MLSKSFMKMINQTVITNSIKVFMDVGGVRRIGEVIGINAHTTWVRLREGAKTYSVIKRHNKKHNLKLFKVEGILDGTYVHTSTEHETEAA